MDSFTSDVTRSLRLRISFKVIALLENELEGWSRCNRIRSASQPKNAPRSGPIISKDILELSEAFWVEKHLNETLIKDHVSPEIFYSSPITGSYIGIEKLKKMHELYRSLFKDIRIDLLDLKQQDTQYISVWNFEAVYNGIPKHIKKENFTDFFSYQYIDILEKSNIIFKKVNYNVNVFISYNAKRKLSAYCSTIDMQDIYQNLGVFVKNESYKEEYKLYNSEQLITERLKNISNKLTKRELECLSLNLYGFSAKQIATIVSTSYRTVQSQLGNAINKVECFNKIDCIEKFYESEVLDIWNDLAKILMRKYKK